MTGAQLNKMTSNTDLRALHFERLARMGTGHGATHTGHEPTATAEFECAVCYTNGDSSGLVIPKCCSHKICLGCYTNIVLRSGGADSRCPQCRTVFLKKGTVVDDSHDDDYSDLPPLISLDDLGPRRAHTELEAAHSILRSLIYITASQDFLDWNPMYPLGWALPAAPNPMPAAPNPMPTADNPMPEMDWPQADIIPGMELPDMEMPQTRPDDSV